MLKAECGMGNGAPAHGSPLAAHPNEAAVTALAPWFGAKRTLAPRIVEELGPHAAYWEPFCGSMAVLLVKPESSHETVNDLHGDLINLARVIRDEAAGPRLYRRLRRTLLHEHLLAESWAALAALPPPVDEVLAPERAYHYFCASWSGRNGFAGTTNVAATRGLAVRWTPTGGHGGQRFASAAASVPHFRRRLRRATILRRDAFEVIAKIDDAAGVALYVDPPYLVKDGQYEHDLTDDDHARLARALARFRRARVVVSYYAHPRLAALYPGWTIRDVAVTKGLHNAGRRGQQGKKAPEVLLLNGPSYAATDAQAELF